MAYRLDPHAGPYFIVNMVLGGSALASGLVEINDILHAVNGHSVYESSIEEVRALIVGTPGSSVTLRISRPSAEDESEVRSSVRRQSSDARMQALCSRGM